MARKTDTVSLSAKYEDDKDLLIAELKTINDNWGWLVKSVSGTISEVDSDIKIEFHNGDEIHERYVFKPFGGEPEELFGRINSSIFRRKDTLFNELYLGNWPTMVDCIIHYYLDFALRLNTNA